MHRSVKPLEDAVSLAAVGSFMNDDGWAFYNEPGVVPDALNGARYLREVYQKADLNIHWPCHPPSFGTKRMKR